MNRIAKSWGVRTYGFFRSLGTIEIMAKRILIVTNSRSGGGAERAMNLLANLLFSEGFDVKIAYVSFGPSDSINVVPFHIDLNRKRKNLFFSALIPLIKYQKLVIQYKPNYTLLNCDFPEMLGAFSFGGSTRVVVEHTHKPFNGRKIIGVITRMILIWRKSLFISVSSMKLVWPSKRGFDDCIENLFYSDFKTQLNFQGELRELFYVGRLSPEKRPDIALEIAHRLEVPIKFVGEGGLLTSLKQNAQILNINATFLGFQENPWVHFEKNSLLIVPSDHEGDGLVVIEALAANFPLVLRKVDSLYRFNLPEINYASTIEEFVDGINLHRNNISSFVPPVGDCETILSARNPRLILSKWLKWLK